MTSKTNNNLNVSQSSTSLFCDRKRAAAPNASHITAAPCTKKVTSKMKDLKKIAEYRINQLQHDILLAQDAKIKARYQADLNRWVNVLGGMNNA